MTTHEAKKAIRDFLGRRDGADIKGICMLIGEFGRDLPRAIQTAAYTVSWASSTGRLSGGFALRLRGMTRSEAIDMLAFVGAKEPSTVSEALEILRASE